MFGNLFKIDVFILEIMIFIKLFIYENNEKIIKLTYINNINYAFYN